MVKQEFKSFLLVLLLAIGLRFTGITFDSMWLDEGYQSMADSHGQTIPDLLDRSTRPFLFKFGPPQSLSATLETFRQVDPLCPPLYAVLLNRWMSVFGQSDLAVRTLSAVLSLCSLTAVYSIGRIFLGSKPALLAMILQAVSPFDIHYAQEARMYALEILAAALSCGSLLWLLSGGGSLADRSFACICSFELAVINSHYTGLFLLLFQGIYSVWACLKQRNWRLFLWLCACWASILLLWLPWFDIFRHASANRTASFYVARPFSWTWPLTALLLRIPLNWLSFLCGNRVALYAIPIYGTGVLLLLSGLLATLGGGKISRKLHVNLNLVEGRGAALKFLWAWAFLPAVFIWLIDIVENHRVVEISRYTVASSPAVYLLAGTGAAVIYGPALLSRLVVLLHIAMALVNNAVAHVVHQREPWREMAASVDSLCAAEDLLLVAQYYDIVCLDRYLSRPLRQVGIGSNFPPAEIERLIGDRSRFWLLTAQEGESAAGIMPVRFRVSKRVDLSHGLHLRLYEK